jgi:hypothetical protein
MGRMMGRNAKRAARARFYVLLGGEGGIRTPEAFDRPPDFESGTFNHSATSPVFLYSRWFVRE